AALLVEFDDGGLSVGPQLGRGGAEGIGRLQGVAPLHPTVAPAALADMDVELAGGGVGGGLHLVLLGGGGRVEGAAAVGANAGQGCLMNLIDLIGSRRLTMGLRAVVRAGLASWLLGLGCGRALGEGDGLALAGAARLVELAAEAIVLSLQVAD